MGWSLGYDEKNKRWVGYGVPAYCDHKGCKEEIDRGLAYVCGGDIFGGENGCGLHFCPEHLTYNKKGIQLCEKCVKGNKPFKPSEEHPDWIKHLLKDKSWREWRKENPEEVKKLKEQLKKSDTHE